MTTDIDTSTDTGISSDALAEVGTLAAPLLSTAELPKLSESDPQQFELLTRLANLQEALLAKDPMMPTHLAAIHKALIQHEELVHLLTDDQIGQIVTAQQNHVNTFLAAEVTTKSGASKAATRAKGLTLNDL